MAEMDLVSDKEAQRYLSWLVRKGAWFDWGSDTFEDLVHQQVLTQMKMYGAAARIFERYGLAAIGIPYQLGLVRQVPASDLAEGMLNNSERPDVRSYETKTIIQKGRPIVHFGCAGDDCPGSVSFLKAAHIVFRASPATRVGMPKFRQVAMSSWRMSP